MGLLRAFTGALGGTFADQWKDIYTADSFDEHVLVSPGKLKQTNRGRGSNLYGSDGIISNGSKIYVPENTAAFIFSQSGIEEIITEPGGYEYQNGQNSVFNGNGIGSSIFGQVKERFGYGGISSDEKRIAFVNLREIRGIKFGTKGAQVYNDLYYGVDLEIYAYGSFTIKIIDPISFIRNFVPPNINYYTVDEPRVREQLLSEFLQSFIVSLNSLSENYRISRLPSQSNEISKAILNDDYNAGTWVERFGIKIIHVSIENIEFSDESRELVNQFSSNKMNLRAYEDVSKNASDIAAQQKIAQGIQEHGFGEGGGMFLGMNMAQSVSQSMSPPSEPRQEMSFDAQIAALKELKSLLDSNILTQEEFDKKKKEIMGL